MRGMQGIDRFTRALAAYGQAVPEIPRRLAPFVVADVQEHIRSASSPANAPLTRALKGNKGPLKDTGALRARITYRLEPLTLIVGSNGIQDRLLHAGGTISAQNAEKLAIPATRRIKLATEASGVRGYLDGRKAAGWRIVFTPGAILGIPPRGRQQLLYIRKASVTIPARPYMHLTPPEISELRQMVREILRATLG